MRVLVWFFRIFIFVLMLVFALNNQQQATVRWIFGMQWQAPMVIVVLAAFAGGCAIGVLMMVPSWWRHRRVARRHAPPAPPAPVPPPSSMLPSEFGPEHPPREGL